MLFFVYNVCSSRAKSQDVQIILVFMLEIWLTLPYRQLQFYQHHTSRRIRKHSQGVQSQKNLFKGSVSFSNTLSVLMQWLDIIYQCGNISARPSEDLFVSQSISSHYGTSQTLRVSSILSLTFCRPVLSHQINPC